MQNAKEFWKSKTFWVNVLAFLVILLTQLKEALSTEAAVTVLVAVNIILRALTTSGIKLK